MKGSTVSVPPQRTKFVADAMLGSLARKLRAFGFDTSYYRKGGDEGIISLAKVEGRVILTSDRALQKRAISSSLVALLLIGGTDGKRISSLLDCAQAAQIPLVRGEPLCSLCGGELATVSRGDIASRVPAQVARRHRLFLCCTRCRKLYWRGGHWKKLRRLERAFGSRT